MSAGEGETPIYISVNGEQYVLCSHAEAQVSEMAKDVLDHVAEIVSKYRVGNVDLAALILSLKEHAIERS